MNKKVLITGMIVLCSAVWLLLALFLFLPKRRERLNAKDKEAIEQILPCHDMIRSVGETGAKVSESIEIMQQVITDFEVPRQNIVTASLEQVNELYLDDEFAGLLVVCSHGTLRGDMFYIAAALEKDGRIHDITALPTSRMSGNADSVLSDSFLSQIIGKKEEHFGLQTSKIADSGNIIIAADDIPATEAVISCVNLSLYCYECYYSQDEEEGDGFYVE